MKWLSAVSLSSVLMVSPVFVVSASAAPVAASAQQQSLRSLQKLETLTHKALHAYFMFVIQERAPLELKKMNEYLAQGDVLVAGQTSADIQTRWQDFRKALATDPYEKRPAAQNFLFTEGSGNVSQRLLYAAEDASALVVDSLRSQASSLRTTARIPVSKDADSLFELSTLMESLTTIYLRNIADPIGGANYSGLNKQKDPALLAEKFSQMLAQVRVAYRNNEAVSRDLAQVFQKWNFIHGRMTDFNQKTVPFIVEKYNEQITQRLNDAYEKALR